MIWGKVLQAEGTANAVSWGRNKCKVGDAGGGQCGWMEVSDRSSVRGEVGEVIRS